jgi:hypothetical protein
MPSLEQVANELQSILEDERTNTTAIKSNTTTIKNDTAKIKTTTGEIHTQLDQLTNALAVGFSNLGQGLGVLISLGTQANELAADNNNQNETIICWLTTIANVLCDIKRDMDEEIALQTAMAATLKHLNDIGELVHGREAIEVANRDEIQQRLDSCCPPEVEPVEPCFEPCISPTISESVRVKSTWEPLMPDR